MHVFLVVVNLNLILSKFLFLLMLYVSHVLWVSSVETDSQYMSGDRPSQDSQMCNSQTVGCGISCVFVCLV